MARSHNIHFGDDQKVGDPHIERTGTLVLGYFPRMTQHNLRWQRLRKQMIEPAIGGLQPLDPDMDCPPSRLIGVGLVGVNVAATV